MKRLFLPAAARAQLMEHGMATVRNPMNPQPDRIHDGAWCGTWRNGYKSITSAWTMNRLPERQSLLAPFCPTPPGAEYWVPEVWLVTQISGPAGTLEFPNILYEQDFRTMLFINKLVWKYNKPNPAEWRSPATMPRWAARLFVRIAAVCVVRDGDMWFWEMDTERIEK